MGVIFYIFIFMFISAQILNFCTGVNADGIVGKSFAVNREEANKNSKVKLIKLWQ